MQTKIILVAVLAVLSVVLVGVLGYQKLTQPETIPVVVNQPQVNCLKEGEINSTGYNSSEASLDCCTGLNFIPVANAWRNSDGLIDTTCNEGKLGVPYNVVCTYCGNEVCGTGENKCNCPEDCGNALGAQIISANLSETKSDGQIVKVKFNHEIDPKTITKKTVSIEATCTPADSGDPSLWGKNFVGSLNYDSSNKILTIVPQSALVGYTDSCSWDLTLTAGIIGKDGQTFVGSGTSLKLTPYLK